ncbi:uracil-DNA glycosylase [Solirhodobacter olei]|uniref:uracil-DNA glycosylase n=1 Tax=Solirhodobacter olei TaxID=2493082 RepID=UPI000FDA79AB|nr:uracil-DNA glycosylase [Solirhodobacter olei]
MTDLPSAWAHLPFFTTRWPAIAERLAAEPGPVFPAPERIFRALALVPPRAVRVVILGQDPYPTPGNADGLAFSVPPGRPLPASLRNIFAELEADTGRRPASGDLSPWARQGVLLLNTALTVPSGSPGGHAKLGWRSLVTDVLAEITPRPAAFLLWGRHAQGLALPHTDPARHLVLTSVHPSPLSAHRGFFGTRPFGAINAWLTARGEAPIDWSAPA